MFFIFKNSHHPFVQFSKNLLCSAIKQCRLGQNNNISFLHYQCQHFFSCLLDARSLTCYLLEATFDNIPWQSTRCKLYCKEVFIETYIYLSLLIVMVSYSVFICNSIIIKKQIASLAKAAICFFEMYNNSVDSIIEELITG